MKVRAQYPQAHLRKVQTGNGGSLLDAWQHTLGKRGNAPAVFGPTGEVLRTFQELDDEAAGIASRIRRLGDRRAVVALRAPNVAAWPAMFLGILRAAGIALLQDFEMGGPARLATESACGVTHRLVWEDDRVVSDAIPPTGSSQSELPYLDQADVIKLTSGTTGMPRGIAFTGDQLIADCDTVCDTMGIAGDDLNFGAISFAHSYGFSNLVTPLICRGIPLVATRDTLPRSLIDSINASQATVLPLVPALFDAMAKLGGSLPGLRLCISAGAPLRPETYSAFRNAFGQRLHTFYGATECGGICYDRSGEGSELSGFVGGPMIGVRLVSDFPTDGTGTTFRVASRAVGLGSIPVSHDDRMREGQFQPGDLLASCEGGYRVTGRTDDTINIAGRKLDPHQVEFALCSHPAVRDAIAFGWADDRRGEAVYAAVCLKSPTREESIRAQAAAHLAPWQQPRKIFILEELPVNGRGKLSRTSIANDLMGLKSVRQV